MSGPREGMPPSVFSDRMAKRRSQPGPDRRLTDANASRESRPKAFKPPAPGPTSTALDRVGPGIGSMQDIVTWITRVERENKQYRAATEEELHALRYQVDNELRKGTSGGVDKVDALSTVVRLLRGDVDDLTQGGIHRTEMESMRQELDILAKSCGDMQDRQLVEVRAAVDDHDEGLHTLMNLLEDCFTKQAAEDLLDEALARGRSGIEASEAKSEAALAEVVQKVEALHADMEGAVSALQDQDEELEQRANAHFEEHIEAVDARADRCVARRVGCVAWNVQNLTGRMVDHRNKQLADAANVESQKQFDRKVEQLDTRIEFAEGMFAAHQRKLSTQLEEHQRDVAVKVDSTDTELRGSVQSIDAKFESLSVTLSGTTPPQVFHLYVPDWCGT
jgi:hypothetical protein